MHKPPANQRITADRLSQVGPEGEEVWALKVVLKIIGLVRTSKEAWQTNLFMIPSGGGPPIAPTLNDLEDFSTSTHLQGVPTPLKKYGVVEVKIIRMEQ